MKIENTLDKPDDNQENKNMINKNTDEQIEKAINLSVNDIKDADTLDTAGSAFASEAVSISAAHTMFTWICGPTYTFNAGDVLGVKATFTAAPGDVEGALVLMYKVQ